MKTNEEYVEEFDDKFGAFTFNNGGALEFTLWDVVDERIHHEDEVGLVMQDWLRTTLEAKDKECEKRVVKARLDAFKEVYDSKEFQTLEASLPTKTDKQDTLCGKPHNNGREEDCEECTVIRHGI